MMTKTVVVLQPGYLPWLGFFDQLIQSDVFIYYDNVQYDKHGWRNRNRIRSDKGQPHWLTVPVLHSGLGKPLIKEVKIDQKHQWAKKQLGSLRQFYSKAPYFDLYFPEIERILLKSHEYLIDLDLELVLKINEWLGLEKKMLLASDLKDIQGEQTERLVSFCTYFQATHYLSGSAARDYLDVSLFQSKGIEVVWHDYQHPVYPQQYEQAGPFLPYLSIIDLILNVGGGSYKVLKPL